MPIEFIGSLDDDEEEGHGGEACKNCGKLYGDCTCIGGFIDEYKVKGKLKKLYCGEKANLRLEHLEGYYNKFMAG